MENLRKMEEENDNLKSQVKQFSMQLDTSLCKQNSTQQINEELTNKVSTQKPQGGEKFELCDSWPLSWHPALLHHRNATNCLVHEHSGVPEAPLLSWSRVCLHHPPAGWEGSLPVAESLNIRWRPKPSVLWHQVFQSCLLDQSWGNSLFGGNLLGNTSRNSPKTQKNEVEGGLGSISLHELKTKRSHWLLMYVRHCAHIQLSLIDYLVKSLTWLPSAGLQRRERLRLKLT